MMMADEKRVSGGDAAGISAALIGAGISKVLGMALLIPTVFGFLSFFVLRYVDKVLRKRNKAFGALGTRYPENFPVRELFAVEFGHLLWGVVGVCIFLSGAVKTDYELDASNFAEAAIFLALVLFLFAKPNWLGIALLASYHCAAIVSISRQLESLSGNYAIRAPLEKGFLTHILFHGLAIFMLAWLSYALLSKGRTLSDTVKSFIRRQTAFPAPAADAHTRLTRLQELRNGGLISEADFERKKAEVLRDL
jgi:hypothetical protein